LVIEISLYYDARSKKHNTRIIHVCSETHTKYRVRGRYVNIFRLNLFAQKVTNKP